MGTTSIRRRGFLKASAASIACIGVPTIVPSYVLGKDAPSNTLRIGCIGTGRMGHGDMNACLRSGLDPQTNAHIVAVCDLDRRRVEHARQQCDEIYSDKLTDRPGPTIEMFDDYRELLSREDIDGVTISTPDHWHALVAIAAAESGKAIYLQKPLTHTIAEGQKLVAAVRKNNVILQTGSQQRSDHRFRLACELVRSGRIGKLHTIRVQLPTDHGTGEDVTMSVPEQLNYDMWLGPTPRMPYTEHRVHPQSDFSRPGWLQIESYCRGMITGWGAHMFDIAQWGHDSDDSGPVEMEASGEFPDRGLFNVHTEFQAEGRYADGVNLLASSGTPAGVTFEGDAGSIVVTRSSLTAQPGGILREPIGEGEVHLYHSDNHMQNFLQCMRTHQEPICPVEVGHRSNSICVITHLAMKLGRKLRWNPVTERFVDDQAANDMLDYEHRKPWTV
ncbi:Inositol 2-dehydrogenase [Stieleria neptunia]|uniref:Inositol 2-dehydrogenase n=1 Tax=Stieleria neptunia TaxID=2527979 RepID=A0A518HXJ8_9BACT|nr:Gfo/Idh/MocA family oxidoreductase [Stieleria neptunia]QDV45586.1 Inositol 2-dehydrogenase [Stieleria neptunia]